MGEEGLLSPPTGVTCRPAQLGPRDLRTAQEEGRGAGEVGKGQCTQRSSTPSPPRRPPRWSRVQRGRPGRQKPWSQQTQLPHPGRTQPWGGPLSVPAPRTALQDRAGRGRRRAGNCAKGHIAAGAAEETVAFRRAEVSSPGLGSAGPSKPHPRPLASSSTVTPSAETLRSHRPPHPVSGTPIPQAPARAGSTIPLHRWRS